MDIIGQCLFESIQIGHSRVGSSLARQIDRFGQDAGRFLRGVETQLILRGHEADAPLRLPVQPADRLELLRRS
jgi:hypothetical protein